MLLTVQTMCVCGGVGEVEKGGKCIAQTLLVELFNRIKQKTYNAYKYCCVFIKDF